MHKTYLKINKQTEKKFNYSSNFLSIAYYCQWPVAAPGLGIWGAFEGQHAFGGGAR